MTALGMTTHSLPVVLAVDLVLIETVWLDNIAASHAHASSRGHET